LQHTKHIQPSKKQERTCSRNPPSNNLSLVPSVEPRTLMALLSVITAAQGLLPLKSHMAAPKIRNKGGATEETAQKIADVLRSKYQLEVDLVDLKEQKLPDLSQYRNVVVGRGVRDGKVYDKALKFLENDLSGKRVVFFVSSGQAGAPASYEKAKVKFVENNLAKYPKINSVAWEAFGGRIRILGKTVSDTTDSTKVKVWAEELGKKFTQ
jgi:menaquinone-dependent protoporphyrinogen IX oxidase